MLPFRCGCPHSQHHAAVPIAAFLSHFNLFSSLFFPPQTKSEKPKKRKRKWPKHPSFSSSSSSSFSSSSLQSIPPPLPLLPSNPSSSTTMPTPIAHRPPPSSALSASDKFEGSSNLIYLRYHMGPVLSSPINIYLIWYGRWAPHQQLLLKDFLLSISSTSAPSPSVSDWWRIVSLYTDQTGANVSHSLLIAGEFSDAAYSRGRSLTRLSIQQVIHNAVSASRLAVDPRNGIYLVLTSPNVVVQDFCRTVCGFHYFTFPSIVSYTLPYA